MLLEWKKSMRQKPRREPPKRCESEVRAPSSIGRKLFATIRPGYSSTLISDCHKNLIAWIPIRFPADMPLLLLWCQKSREPKYLSQKMSTLTKNEGDPLCCRPRQ